MPNTWSRPGTLVLSRLALLIASCRCKVSTVERTTGSQGAGGDDNVFRAVMRPERSGRARAALKVRLALLSSSGPPGR